MGAATVALRWVANAWTNAAGGPAPNVSRVCTVRRCRNMMGIGSWPRNRRDGRKLSARGRDRSVVPGNHTMELRHEKDPAGLHRRVVCAHRMRLLQPRACAADHDDLL